MQRDLTASSNTTPSDTCFMKARKFLADTPKILENIMASMGDGLSIQDRNMRIVYQNKFMIEHFGSHVGSYCYNVYEKRNVACDGCPIIESYRTGRVTKALRVGITKDGTPFRFENIASVLRNEQGEIVAGIELCRIVEERERALDELRTTMEQLKQTQKELVRSEKLAGIGQLAAGVAHEINNPAAFVLSNLRTIRDYVRKFFTFVGSLESLITFDAPDEQQSTNNVEEEMRNVVGNKYYAFLKNELPDVIEESLQGMQRIKTIVSSLLTFADASSEERSLADTNMLLESALTLLNDNIDNKQAHVVTILGPLPPLHANTQQLRQMFLNMLLNALQAINNGGTITVKTSLQDDRINIEITDDGVGMSEKVIRNIFNPFFTTRDVGNGAGLGLSIAYRIIESHNGTIDVQSKPGHGTTFTIKLPLNSPDNSAKGHPLSRISGNLDS